MQVYKVKSARLSGTRYTEVYDKAFLCYKQTKKKTKRRPYVRSSYFKKSKVFLGLFWSHLDEKNTRDRTRQMRFLPAAIELIRHTPFDPISKENPNKTTEVLHRFFGKTADDHKFVVQVKEDKRSGHKYFLSVYPT